MKTLPLGKTGEHVSALSLGTMYFGSKNDEETSWKLLDQYVEAGGTFLDTANAYARWMLGLSVRDCSGAFRCYRTDQLRRIDLAQMRSRGYSYLEELLWMLKRSGARIVEIPIVFTDRQHGQTKISSREALATLWVLLCLGIRNHLCR